MNLKEYLGDGVSVDWDGDNIILTSENEDSTLDIICLEPPVVQKLIKYIKKYSVLLGGTLKGGTK